MNEVKKVNQLTIEHTNLNRLNLAKARHEIYNGALKLRLDLEAERKSLDDMPKINKNINKMKRGKYGNYIKEVFEQYLTIRDLHFD